MKPSTLGLEVLRTLTHFQLQELARRVNNAAIYALFSEKKDLEQTSKLLGLEKLYNQYTQNIEILIEKNQKNSNQQIVHAMANYRLYLLEQMCLPDRSKNQ